MSGIFSIFSETENRNSLSFNNGKENSKLKSIGNSGPTLTKNFVQPSNKPKGLSIRSKSDLNVSTFYNAGVNKLNPKKPMILQNSTQCISNRQSLSPMKLKTPKSKSLTNITAKKLSPKISSPIMQNVVDDFVFKKPSTPKKFISYPEPECLSYYYHPSKCIDEEIESIFNEDRMWMRSVTKANDSVTSLEDEGFISDPEADSFKIESATLSPLSSLSDIELPEISDIDDD